MGSSREKQRRKEDRNSGFDSKGAKNAQEVEAERKRRKQTKTALVTLCAIAIIAVVALVLNSNLFYRNVSALNAPGHSFSVTEMNFFARQNANFDAAADRAAETVLLYQRAQAAGLSISPEVQEEIDEWLRMIDEDYLWIAFANDLWGVQTANGLIVALYGRGMNARILRELLEFEALADAYLPYFVERFEAGLTQADIEAYYLENRASYDSISFHALTLFYAPDEDIDAGIAPVGVLPYSEAREMFDIMTNFLSTNTSPEDFVDMVELVTGHHFPELHRTAEEIAFEPFASWLTASARRPGNTTILENEDSFSFLHFVGIDDNSHYTVNVRHILVTADQMGGDNLENLDWLYDEDELAAILDELPELALAHAETLMANILAVPAEEREALFIEYVEEYSADNWFMNSSPGLFEEVDHNTGFVEPFADWSLDPARRPGDIAIVETQFGYHIMYFVQWNDEMPHRYVLARRSMSQTALDNWWEETRLEASWSQTFFSRLVG